MANVIKQKRGTSDPGASDLVVGELAINTTDGGVFTKTDGGTVVEVGSSGGGGASEIDDLSDAVTNSSGATIGLGSGALANDDGTNNNNVALGKDALNDVTGGTSNIGIGSYAGSKITTLSDNIYIGYTAGEYTANPRNIGIGTSAGRGTFGSATAFDNVSVGYQAGQSYTTAYYNALLGNEAGHDITTGQKNTFVVIRLVIRLQLALTTSLLDTMRPQAQ